MSTDRKMLSGHVPEADDITIIPIGQQITDAVEEAEARVEVVKRVMMTALKILHPQDIVDFGGRPYVTAPGAERLAALFKISTHDAEVKRYDDKDGRGQYYFYVVSGQATMTIRVGPKEFTHTVSALGTCSARDPFFARRSGVDLPAEAVDQPSVIKAAHSNLEVNLITRLLGIRGLEWPQLEALGFDRSKAARVQFRSGGARGGAAAPATGTSRAVTREAPSIPAAPPEAPANGQNGGAPGVGPEVQALQQAIAQTTGEPYDAPASLSLLQSCTAFKDYVGTRDWTRVRPQAALVAIERLRKAREKQVLQQSQQTPLGQ